jgi:hypothetical protein
MARGGKRPGAGRKKGVLNKRTQELAARALAQGVTPLDVMLDNMRFAYGEASDLLKSLVTAVNKNLPADKQLDALNELMRMRGIAQDCACNAAPYMHPRLAAVEHKTDANEPMVFVNRIELVGG